MVEVAGPAATGRAATRAAALVEAAALAETIAGQGASTAEAVGRALVWRRSWRRLATTGGQRCCICASCRHCTLEVPLALGSS